MSIKRFTLIFSAILLFLAVAVTAVACEGTQPETPTTQGQGDTEPAATVDPTTEEVTTEAVTDDGRVTYTVTVVDVNGAPVQGVAVQFCDAGGCRMPMPTNAEGVVTLVSEPSDFHVTLVDVPVGYAADATEYYFNGELSLSVTLQAE